MKQVKTFFKQGCLFLKKIIGVLGASQLMTLLFIILIVSLALGTILDANSVKSPSSYTNSIIYKSKWLEWVIGLLAINFIVNISKYKMLQRKQWSVLLLHVAFLIIILGAGITRYFGYEGIVNIREKETVNSFYSNDSYLNVFIDGIVDGRPIRKELDSKKVLLSERLDNKVELISEFDTQEIKIKIKDFKESAQVVEKVTPSEFGMDYLTLIENSNGKRNKHLIKINSSIKINESIISFGSDQGPSTISITEHEGRNYLRSARLGLIQDMVTQNLDTIFPDSSYELSLLKLYHFGDISFIVPEGVVHGILSDSLTINEKSPYSGLKIEISTGENKKIVNILGRVGEKPRYKRADIEGFFVNISFGSIAYELPFSITLTDFLADRYPGTGKVYKAFKSKVKIEDEISFLNDIYMNHPLDYKGYRLFQASFDDDERGTYLSISHDRVGRIITYIGYVLLFISLVCLLWDNKSRFSYLKKTISVLNTKRSCLLLLFLIVFSRSSLGGGHAEIYQSKIEPQPIEIDLARKFGSLMIQDENGRMKPLNTYGSELIRKVSKQSYFKQFNSDQIIFSFIQFPENWLDIKLIKLKRGNDSIRSILDLPRDQKFASLNDFYTQEKKLKLPLELVKKASKGFNPTKFEKDILRAFEDQYLLGKALNGDVLRLFPIPYDSLNKWVSYHEFLNNKLRYADEEFLSLTRKIFEEKKNDPKTVTRFINELKEIQYEYGKDILPARAKVEFEILYNKVYVFQRIFIVNLITGLLLLLLSILKIFWNNKRINAISQLIRWIIYVSFIFFLLGLVSRWYISGHAPWSDAYESIVYVAFVSMFFGIVFGKRSSLTLAATCFVSSMILMVAHWNFIDPAISNLLPVLDSYWLMIHVSIIVASYGPFTLSMAIGLLTLIISLFVNSKTLKDIKPIILELSIINEMSMTIGLVMLSVGNFLGAIWANESWGRYWAWDPKETWALISILIYAFILHMRLIPGLKSKLIFTIASVVSYGSIMMTYFGVNFYLSGLHSYASANKNFAISNLWLTLVSLVIICSLSLIKNRKHKFI